MTAVDAARVRLTALRLTDFRNYERLSVRFSGGPVALVGDNGVGKTNLLEAISLLTPGRGLRRATYDEIARAGAPADGRPPPDAAEGSPVAAAGRGRSSGATDGAGVGAGAWAVAATVEDGLSPPVAIGTGTTAGEPQRGRRIRIDGAEAEGAAALLDHLAVLWLVPAMDGLFTGSPGDRRRFLDRMVLAIDAGHAARVTAYERALAERNRVLEEGGARGRVDSWLDGLEVQIAELGTAIAAARRELVDCLAPLLPEAGEDRFPTAALTLAGEVEAALAGRPAAEAEAEFRRALVEGRPRDRAAGRTLAGPHRTDLLVTHAEKDRPAAAASTGEQKALLVGLVLAHARLVARLTRRTPILLLDEIAAHLDPGRRAALFRRLAELEVQAFMTGTEPALFAALPEGGERFRVAGGGLERMG